jgi:hypothetical protein
MGMGLWGNSVLGHQRPARRHLATVRSLTGSGYMPSAKSMAYHANGVPDGSYSFVTAPPPIAWTTYDPRGGQGRASAWTRLRTP